VPPPSKRFKKAEDNKKMKIFFMKRRKPSFHVLERQRKIENICYFRKNHPFRSLV